MLNNIINNESLYSSSMYRQQLDTIAANLTANLTANFAIVEDNINGFFLIITGIGICLLQSGFACLEAGVILQQNMANIMLKNFLDTFISCLVFWICGYGLAFSKGNYFVGLKWWMGYDMPPTEWPRWFHQVTYASTASTVISGAVAERCAFVAYFFYNCVMTGIIYPIVCHWVWSDEGWLKKMHFIDFAGGTVIHAVAGVASLVAASLLGPRVGRFEFREQFIERKSGSPPLIGLGGILLLTGFISFNAGSLGHITEKNDGYLLGQITSNTVMGGAGGAIIVLFACRSGLVGKRSWNLVNTVNGGVAGMVSVCAGCNLFTMLEALITGVVAGVIFIVLHHTIIALKIDDPLDASPVHMGAGVWSTLSIPLVSESGMGWDYISNKLAVSGIGVASIVIWTLFTSFLLFGFLSITGLFRASETKETVNRDTSNFNGNFVQIPKIPTSSYSNQGPSDFTLHNLNLSSLNTRVYTVTP